MAGGRSEIYRWEEVVCARLRFADARSHSWAGANVSGANEGVAGVALQPCGAKLQPSQLAAHQPHLSITLVGRARCSSSSQRRTASAAHTALPWREYTLRSSSSPSWQPSPAHVSPSPSLLRPQIPIPTLHPYLIHLKSPVKTQPGQADHKLTPPSLSGPLLLQMHLRSKQHHHPTRPAARPTRASPPTTT
jgi:hypothetical protein